MTTPHTSRAARMTEKNARAFLRRQREAFEADAVPTPCEYGHLDCSDVAGGACLDEVLGLFPQLEEE